MDKQIALSEEAYNDLLALADTLGFSPEMAAHYAVRLVHACVREGLLTDVPETLWPEEAGAGICALRSTGTLGKVIDFPSRR